MDTEQTTLLATSLREVLAGPAKDVQRHLAELGWDEVVADDEMTATKLLFTEHGRSLARTALLDAVVLRALNSGAHTVDADAVCYPSPAHAARPSSTAQEVQGLLLRPPAPDARVLVPVDDDGTTRLAVVPATDLKVAPASSFDDELEWQLATGRTPSELGAGDRWPQAVAGAHRALAAEIISTARESLRLAVEHTSVRHQFGAPIAAFQAVRHRLADAHVALTAAEALLDAAFIDDGSVSAMAAKAQAGRAHQLTSLNAIQVCGAIGSTLEHPLHRFVARGLTLDALLGGWEPLTGELGELVATTGTTPRLVEV
jgi:hypothetical protein